MTIKANRAIVIWRVDVVFLTSADWKYEGSSAGAGQGGRTHSFGVIRAAEKLRSASAYAYPGSS
jgi:hypothetical protein